MSEKQDQRIRYWPAPKTFESGCAMCRLDILEGHGHLRTVSDGNGGEIDFVTLGSRLEWV